ncbi:MAG TPA: cytochrome c maturation protein CcmE [Anaerolineaceae bacterium]|nr:cytochrome c maturation protein CcmE [Anaerolineaceae bacterium]
MKKKNTKLIIGIVIIVAAVVYLIASSTLSQSQYFLTVEELQSNQAEYVGKNVRMSGAVLGDTIEYDPQTLELTFQVAQIPGDHRVIEQMGGMSVVLAQAAHDPTLPKMTVHYVGPRPDLLKDEAQAIITGSLDENGIFQASELLLKCPSKYQSELPEQSK